MTTTAENIQIVRELLRRDGTIFFLGQLRKIQRKGRSLKKLRKEVNGHDAMLKASLSQWSVGGLPWSSMPHYQEYSDAGWTTLLPDSRSGEGENKAARAAGEMG